MEEKKNNSNIFITSAICLIAAIAICVFLIPIVENNVLTFKHKMIIRNISASSNGEALSNRIDVSKFELGDPIAVLIIPSIDLEIPVFKGTSDLILDNAIGLADGTGDLNEGVGRNPLLCGHNGLSTATLFTNLPKLKKGDRFYLNIDEEYLAYEIKQEKTVEGNNLDDYPERFLTPKKDKDLVTLMTCVPRTTYAKRLLLTGHRIPFDENDLKDASDIAKKRKEKLRIVILIAIVIAVLSVLLAFLRKGGGRITK